MSALRFIWLLLVFAAPGRAMAAAATTLPASQPEPSAHEIRQAVRDLNHPSIGKRRAAIRQLAGWGPVAFPELRRAAQDRNLEAALSARDLLSELESAILLGARVHLEVNKTSVSWNEPISLTVVAENPTRGSIRVPWAAPSTQPAGAGRSEAQQVAAMMDAADFLVVTTPDGKTIDPRVEPIERDPAVYAAVDQRARGTPPSHEIGPGQRARLTIPMFNRGWARYPMLLKGTYTIAFLYQPKWKDESWSTEGFGQVHGNAVAIQVKDSAPSSVAHGSTPLEIRVERVAHRLEAVLTSQWDVPLFVNLNLGEPPSTHAKLEWLVAPTRQDNAESTDLAVASTAPEYSPSRVARIEPAGRLVIASLDIDQVKKKVEEITAQHAGEYALQIRYVELSTPTQIREELARLGKPQDVPTQLFSGAVIAEEVLVEPLLK